MPQLRRIKNKNGFTIVELVIVIVVIGILAAISIIGYGAWRQRVATDTLKSDLNGVRSAMDNSRNFGDGFPSALPTTIEASGGVTLTYMYGNDKLYCVQAKSSSAASVTYYLSSSDSTTPKQGTCPPSPL